jgi:hypothetical protein
MEFVLLIFFALLCYPIPFFYCLWLSKKEDDVLFKKVSYLPVTNILMIIYHYTK